MCVHYRAQRNISEIGRGTMIMNHAVGKHGEGGWTGEAELAIPLDTNASPAVGMIHERQFASVGMGLFQRGKFSWFSTERRALSEQRG